MEVNAKTTLRIKNSNVDVGVTGNLLAGGFKVDLSHGVDVKIGLGGVGIGFHINFSNDSIGDIFEFGKTRSIK